MASDNRAFLQHLNDLAIECDERSMERHEMGAEQYGPLKFLEKDTLEMAIEEVLDLINYGRYTYVKLRLLQDYIAQEAAGVVTPDPQAGSFIPTSEMGLQ